MIELRKLTVEERAVWGLCPVCHSGHGKPCMAMTADGKPSRLLETKGAHLGRLVNAPKVAAESDSTETVKL
jgi:hypothetical protein